MLHFSPPALDDDDAFPSPRELLASLGLAVLMAAGVFAVVAGLQPWWLGLLH